MKRLSIVLLLLVLVGVLGSAHAVLPNRDSQGELVPSLAPLLKKVNPAVVNIATYTNRQAHNPLLNDPFFRHFFNVPPNFHQQPQRRSQSAGSGVIIDADKGTVVTNYHVIEGADEIKVSLLDGRTLTAELIGSDPEVDVAVLKIEAKDLTDLTMANSDIMEVGDFVIAIGNPFGLGQTVTTGVVSALGRSGLGIEGYESFIQTDASINPGNSGGALINLRGELIGINTAILSPAGGNVGIGFAIPSNMAKNSIDQILEYGEVRRGQLGVKIQNLNPALARAFGLDEDEEGVLVTEVQEGSAAEKAGIKTEDIIVGVEGKRIENTTQLRNEIGLRQVGEKIKITLIREGKEKTLRANIGEAMQVANAANQLPKKLEGAQLRNTRDGSGVLVAEIQAGSPAQFSGLASGDLIVAANRMAVANVADLQRAIGKNDKRLLLKVIRRNTAFYVVIQ